MKPSAELKPQMDTEEYRWTDAARRASTPSPFRGGGERVGVRGDVRRRWRPHSSSGLRPTSSLLGGRGKAREVTFGLQASGFRWELLAVLLALLCALAHPATAAEAPAKADEVRSYKKVGDRELKLHIAKPADWKATDQRPALVFFFGGGWVGGTPEQFRGQSEYLATRGLVGIRVEYRVIPKGDAGPPTVCCADAKSALRWVRAHAGELGVDPQRIGAAGGSAGGHLAAFTGLVAGQDDPLDDLKVSAKANALVLFNPVFDNGPVGGWGAARVGDRVKDFSPAHNITAAAPPAIVFLGREDGLIPVATVERFQANMKAAGVRCDAHFYEGQAHGFFNQEPFKSRTLTEADKFFASLGWLKGPPTLKEPDAATTPPPAAKKKAKATN